MAKCIKARVTRDSEKGVTGKRNRKNLSNSCQASAELPSAHVDFRSVKQQAQAPKTLNIWQNLARRKENRKQTAF